MSGNPLPDVRSLNKPDLELFFLQHGEKKFRAGQVFEWIWKKPVHAFDEMTNLSKTTRQLLQDHFSLHTAYPETLQTSSDRTLKYGFRLHDGLIVEGVLIPSGERATACVSSQVGCALGCKFCATGLQGFTRNLTAGEIYDQVTVLRDAAMRNAGAHIARGEASDPGNGISNIVFMGMGEPFLNYDQVLGAIEKITSSDGLGMSAQRITVSSVGIPRMIRRMADDDPRYHFALSLHAATDEKRNQVIPLNLKYPLSELTDALRYYHQKTSKRFTVEYILFGNFNDTVSDARDLASFCRNFPVKINLIEYNPVKGSGFMKAEPDKVKAFVSYLEARNLVINLRQSRGKDIDAACGQLAGKKKSDDN